jgi:uncharacterized protein
MPEVVTRGTGEHEVLADQAEIHVTFSADAADRSTAVGLLGERMSGVEPLLTRDGVEVRQRSVAVHSRWEHKRRVGSTAQQHLVLRMSDLAGMDDLLAALFSAEPAWLNGPQWMLADETAATREAQNRAVKDARARAEAYAAALGGRLGALIRLADEGAERPYMATPMADMAMASGGVGRESVRQLGLTPGLVTVRAGCTAVWTLDY